MTDLHVPYLASRSPVVSAEDRLAEERSFPGETVTQTGSDPGPRRPTGPSPCPTPVVNSVRVVVPRPGSDLRDPRDTERTPSGSPAFEKGPKVCGPCESEPVPADRSSPVEQRVCHCPVPHTHPPRVTTVFAGFEGPKRRGVVPRLATRGSGEGDGAGPGRYISNFQNLRL